MKKNPRQLTAFLAASLTPAMCFATAEDSTVQVGGHTIDPVAGAEVPQVDGEAGATERKRAPAANFLSIVRGRFPLLLVHAVRFDEALGKMSTKDLASKMATSVGKVFDIRKGRNFAYLTKDYKPSASDVADAKAWAAQIGQENAKGLQATGDANLVNQIVAQYEAAGLATAEETAKFAASKPKSNFDKKTDGAPAEGKTSKPLPAAAETKAGNADDLLG